MIHVHAGKGAIDRYVPLPDKILTLLREYWKTHRHPRFLFPAVGPPPVGVCAKAPVEFCKPDRNVCEAVRIGEKREFRNVTVQATNLHRRWPHGVGFGFVACRVRRLAIVVRKKGTLPF